jgi:hypothetical protein
MKEKRQIVLATLAMVALFAIYEWGKTLLFPDMSVVTSHVVTTIVAGIITAIIARQVIKRQTAKFARLTPQRFRALARHQP